MCWFQLGICKAYSRLFTLIFIHSTMILTCLPALNRTGNLMSVNALMMEAVWQAGRTLNKTSEFLYVNGIRRFFTVRHSCQLASIVVTHQNASQLLSVITKCSLVMQPIENNTIPLTGPLGCFHHANTFPSFPKFLKRKIGLDVIILNVEKV